MDKNPENSAETQILQDDTLKPLTAKEKIFVMHFCSCLDKGRSALRTGWKYESGFEVYRRPHVKAAIDKTLEALILSEMENKRMISTVATSNIAEYFRPVQVIHHQTKVVSLAVIIKALEEEIETEDEIHYWLQLDEAQREYFNRSQEDRRRTLTRYRVEYKRNPDATRIQQLPAELVEEQQLDIASIIRDKDHIKIKSIKMTKHGWDIELYNALEANNMLARMYGSYDADNRQKANLVKVFSFDPLSNVDDSEPITE